MSDFLEKILNNDKIPSPSSVAVRLIELVSQPEVDVQELTDVLSADPILSARVVDYANTPIVGAKREITDLRQAVLVMGTRMLRLLSLSFSLMETKNGGKFDYEAFWRLSLGTALASKILAIKRGGEGDREFLVGLLLNVGQIGIGNTFPDELVSMLPRDGSLLDISTKKEKEILGVHRFEIGAALTRRWNFPESTVEQIENYDPEHLGKESIDLFIAQQIASLLLGGAHSDKRIGRVKKTCYRAAKLREADFDKLFNEVLEGWATYEELFEKPALDFESIEELQDRTKNCMVQISLDLASEVERLKEEKDIIAASAIIDSLTGLKNRAAYDDEILGTIEYHYRNRRPFGILVIDIDHFKQVNDTHGHANGDEVLRAIAACLRSRTRKYDDVYRFGGEEFVAVITDCALEGISSVAQRFLDSIEKLQIDIEDKTISVTASLGICWTPYPRPGSAEELFKIADGCLYEAKRSGRNRLVMRHADEVAMAAS
ncbi:MAG: diguanylate cyclase [Pirellulaceae bacterium]